MTQQPDLFPGTKPKRRSPKVLMQVVDAGDHGCVTEYKWFVHLVCPKCGHDDGWSEHHTKREAERQPCPVCNR